MAQDDYYYEIQLTNKQLVFYFLAGATLLISSFLLGVMVGRGVDAGGGEVLAAKAVREDKIVPEEPPKPSSSQGLTYAHRLEGDKPAADLETGDTTAKGAKTSKPAKPSPKAETESPEPKPKPAKPKVEAESPEPKPKPIASPRVAEASPAPVSGVFSIQVGAFKDKASAESIVTHLKSKGFAAFVVSTEGTDGDFYIVRVGSYTAKTDAERIERRLRDEEKYKPFIVHQ